MSVNTKVGRGTASARTKRKTGEVSKSVSMGNFPCDLHQFVKNYSGPKNTLLDLWSDAISELRADYDSGKKIIIQEMPENGKYIKLWLREKSDADLRYLAYKLKSFHRQIAYTAIMEWIQKMHLHNKWEAYQSFLKEKRSQGLAP